MTEPASLVKITGVVLKIPCFFNKKPHAFLDGEPFFIEIQDVIGLLKEDSRWYVLCRECRLVNKILFHFKRKPFPKPGAEKT